jgi:6-pyruvoyltetrahydropterin/6-carboxytetrahydropterin synthase
MASEPPPAEIQDRGLPIVEATRVVQFSAAHRLHHPGYGPAENARMYGRCNSPNGHGHTYRLAVTIRGTVSPKTGRLEDVRRLEGVIRTQILPRFDRANLDFLMTPEVGPTSTTEAVAGLLWRILDGALPQGRLWRLRLSETPNNSFELDRKGATARPVPDGPGQKASVK